VAVLKKHRQPNFDLQTIKSVIARAKILRLCGDAEESKIPAENGCICFADIPYPPDLTDADTQSYYAANKALVSYLSDLSLSAVYDIIALMYLGRNGDYDGIQSVPVHRRFAMYDHRHCFENDKQRVIKHMVEKSRRLDIYLETGLRFIKWIS
jgi:hypothetical protein